MDTCPSDFDTNIEIFTGTCDALTSIACNEDSAFCGGYWQASVDFPCAAATTYYVYAGGYNDQTGTLQIRARRLSPLPRRPRLVLSPGVGDLRLTIYGDVGHVHVIQQSPSVAAPGWTLVQSVTLSSDPQTFTLPLPSGTTFWRVIAQ